MTAIAVTQPLRLEMSEQERFFRYFQTEVAGACPDVQVQPVRAPLLTDASQNSALQERMQTIRDHGTSGGERADAIDHCLAGISKLSNEVKDISGSLPAHDQRTYSEVGLWITRLLRN